MSSEARVPRVLLVCSAGGHLAQLLHLEPWWSKCDRTWVTFDTPDARSALADERTVFAFHPTTRNVGNLARNAALAWRVLRRERPDLIISDGAGVAVPFFVLGRLMGARTVYIEVYDRVDSATMTAKLCRPFTDLMCVQWEEQKELYPEGRLIGPLL